MGFFDIANRYGGRDAKNDPLARIDEAVPWEALGPRLETVWRGAPEEPEERKSPPGRNPRDAVVTFKAIVLCALYSLSDDQVEYPLRDRLSFMRRLERLAGAAPTRWSSGEKSARSPHREGHRPAGEPGNTENPDANPARDPREPRDLPSFTSVASIFEVPYC